MNACPPVPRNLVSQKCHMGQGPGWLWALPDKETDPGAVPLSSSAFCTGTNFLSIKTDDGLIKTQVVFKFWGKTGVCLVC